MTRQEQVRQHRRSGFPSVNWRRRGRFAPFILAALCMASLLAALPGATQGGEVTLKQGGTIVTGTIRVVGENVVVSGEKGEVRIPLSSVSRVNLDQSAGPNEAMRSLVTGLEHYAEGTPMRQVLAYLETACQLDPQNDLAAYWLVEMLLNAHQPKRAAQVFEGLKGVLVKTPERYVLLKARLADTEKHPDWPGGLSDAITTLERNRYFRQEGMETRFGVLQLLNENGEPLRSAINKGVYITGSSVKTTEYEEGYILIVSNTNVTDTNPITVTSTTPSFARGTWTYSLTRGQTAWLGALKIARWSELIKSKSGTIEGRVARADGKPAQGVSVSCVFLPDGAQADSKQTDVEGAFAFSLAPGAYPIACTNASPKTPARQVQVEEGKTIKVEFEIADPPKFVRVCARFLINWSNAKAFSDGEYEEVRRSLNLLPTNSTGYPVRYPAGYPGGYSAGEYGGHPGGAWSSFSVLQTVLSVDKGKLVMRRQVQGGSSCQSFLDMGKQGWDVTKSLPDKCRPSFGSATPTSNTDPVVLEAGHVYVGCLMAVVPLSDPSLGGNYQRGLVPFKLLIESVETMAPPSQP